MADTALTTGHAQQLQKVEEASELSLLEFESPSAALTTTPPIGAARSVTWVLAIMVIALLVAAGLIPMEVRVTATGRVIATADTIVIQPFDPSIIHSINVTRGADRACGRRARPARPDLRRFGHAVRSRVTWIPTRPRWTSSRPS